VIFMLLYMIFHSATEAMVLDLPHVLCDDRRPDLAVLLGYNFSVAVWVGYIALFGMPLRRRGHGGLPSRSSRPQMASGLQLTNADIEAAAN